MNLSHLTDIYAACQGTELSVLKKSTRSVGREAKENGRKEYRRIRSREETPRGSKG